MSDVLNTEEGFIPAIVAGNTVETLRPKNDTIYLVANETQDHIEVPVLPSAADLDAVAEEDAIKAATTGHDLQPISEDQHWIMDWLVELQERVCNIEMAIAAYNKGASHRINLDVDWMK